jgi:hypothetical protein
MSHHKLVYESSTNTETIQDPLLSQPFTITRDKKFFMPFLAIQSETKPVEHVVGGTPHIETGHLKH